MKQIKIFLASSIVEFAHERRALKNYIRQLENTLVDYGVYIEMFICEYADNAMSETRKQDDFNKEIEDCDIFMILTGSRLGSYTLEEYRFALGLQRSRGETSERDGAPKLLAAFKECENSDGSVAGFIEELSDTTVRIDFSETDKLRDAITEAIAALLNEDGGDKGGGVTYQLEGNKIIPLGMPNTSIKKIKLFLTHSLRDLESDIEELGAFTENLNDRYISQGIFFTSTSAARTTFRNDKV